MISRRQLLISAAVSAALARVPMDALAAAPAAVTNTNEGVSPALRAVFDRILNERLRLSPETATSYGLDTGSYAAGRRHLDDRSLAGRAENRRHVTNAVMALEACDRSKFTSDDTINFETVIDTLRVQLQVNSRFDNVDSGYFPYTLSQINGAYRSIPDFLDAEHAIRNSEDAQSYLERLQAFAVVLDQEIETVRHDVAAGVRPPDFALDKALLQLRKLRAESPQQSRLVQSIIRRTREQQIKGDWEQRATAIYTKAIQPALDRQAALVEALRRDATSDAGIWKIPNGTAYYPLALRTWTTSPTSADEIHEIGLHRVGELHNAIDMTLREQSLRTGSVNERLQALMRDPRFLYPNDDAGRARVLADVNKHVAAVKSQLAKYFGTLPRSEMRVERVPPAIEAGQSLGYYTWPAMDGSRPGTFYINLRDTREHPTWALPTLVFHEALPGHHLQIALQAETSLPVLRKMSFYSAYSEGWGLYAEQLADEMGMYDDDPFGRVGYLRAQLYRAVRLVLDTGLHHKRWSREQSIRYYVDTVGDQESIATTEVERYCVWPGQACAYMMGKITWERLRRQAQARLGERFDIRAFHDRGLLCGAVPLAVLERILSA